MSKDLIRDIEEYISNNGMSESDSIGYLIENLLEEEKYVPFEDVVIALRKGHSAIYVDGAERISIGANGCMDWTKRFSWKKIIDGKWLIVEDK